jgi:hypothetical protein
MIATEDIEKVERLIKLSETAPLLPEVFVPWHIMEKPREVFMPTKLISLEGHPLYDTLSETQKTELSRREIAQVMYSYAWSEGLACFFFNQRILTLSPDSIEYRYLIKELIEEFRHQDMFSKIIVKLGVSPAKPSWIHRKFAWLSLKIFSPDVLFMSVLAVELVTDVYGKAIRKDTSVFEPLRKISELHHIEEGRHIHYAKLWLKHYTENAGFFRRTFYSIVILSNIYFMRTLYVKEANFKSVGIQESKKYTRAARKNLKEKFGKHCLHDIMSFINEIKGLNFLTKPLWRWVLSASV